MQKGNKFSFMFSRLADKWSPYEKTLGWLTMIFGVGMATIGFSGQIYKNYLEKDCGISAVLLIFACAMYLVRIPYITCRRAKFLLFADLVGFIAIAVIVVQWFLYN